MSYLKKVNPLLLIFLLLGLRLVCTGAGIGDSIAFLSLCAIFGLEKYFVFKRGPDVNAELQKQLNDIKTYVTAMAMKNTVKKEPIEAPKEGQRWF